MTVAQQTAGTARYNWERLGRPSCVLRLLAP